LRFISENITTKPILNLKTHPQVDRNQLELLFFKSALGSPEVLENGKDGEDILTKKEPTSDLNVSKEE
jgi:hypothetical protein